MNLAEAKKWKREIELRVAWAKKDAAKRGLVCPVIDVTNVPPAFFQYIGARSYRARLDLEVQAIEKAAAAKKAEALAAMLEGKENAKSAAAQRERAAKLAAEAAELRKRKAQLDAEGAELGALEWC